MLICRVSANPEIPAWAPILLDVGLNLKSNLQATVVDYCALQVQQELSGTFARLCHLVDESTGDMDNQLKKLELEAATLENAASRAKVLRNKANYLAHELELFEDAYLKSHH